MPGRLRRRDRRCRRQARLRADARRRASSTSAARRRPPTSAPMPASARSPSRCISRLLGEAGFTRLAELNHAKASRAGRSRSRAVPGVKLLNDSFFNEFTRAPAQARPRRWSRRWPPGASSAACRSRGSDPGRSVGRQPAAAGRATETATEHGMAPLVAGAQGGAVMVQSLDRSQGRWRHRRGRDQRTGPPSPATARCRSRSR